jgi:NACalpha-BTF3-like transcription factor
MKNFAQNIKKAAKQLGINSKEITARTEVRILQLPNGQTVRESSYSRFDFQGYRELDEAVNIVRQIAKITNVEIKAYLTYNDKRQVRISISTQNGSGIQIIDFYSTNKYKALHS